MKRRITIEGILRLVNDAGEVYFSTSRLQLWKNIHHPKIFSLEDYFPSIVEKQFEKMAKREQIEIEKADSGWMVKITNKGKQELLKYDLKKMVAKTGSWDGKWRVVFFDVEEIDRKMRDKLRFYIKKLGLRQLQKSVWISPYDISGEIRYIRELFKIPYDVRMGILEEIEFSEELRKWFKV